ncbi:hypothetical protein ACWF5H_01460 [Arthrobacter sp. NPDC055138]
MMDSNASSPAEDPQAGSKHILLTRLEHDQEIATDLKELFPVQQGSVLELDDRALGDYALSGLVMDLLTTATHVSSSLRKLIVMETEEGSRVLAPLHGPYALVRAHLEAMSQALWLMTPQSRRARIKRCIQYWCAEVKLLNGFQAEWAKSFSMPRRIGYEDLRVIAAEAGLPLEGFPAKKKWIPIGSGDILKSVEFAHEDATITWFNTWQLCSGFAHSKQWASKIFNERPSASGEEGQESRGEANTSLPVLAGVVHEAGLLLDEAARRYGQLSMTPNAAWPRRGVL